MSVQILLYGKLLGIEEFVLSAEEARLLVGRAQWITLLSEVLPRALLAEFGLARILLGSSGGGQFLVVLPGEAKAPAEEFLAAAGREMVETSGGRLKLAWAVTENLGDWSVVRKRLTEALKRKLGAAGGGLAAGCVPAFPAPAPVDPAITSASLPRVSGRRKAPAGRPRRRRESCWARASTPGA